MNLDLSDTQALLRDGIRAFLERAVSFDRIRALEADGGWDDVLWPEICQQGPGRFRRDLQVFVVGTLRELSGRVRDRGAEAQRD